MMEWTCIELQSKDFLGETLVRVNAAGKAEMKLTLVTGEESQSQTLAVDVPVIKRPFSLRYMGGDSSEEAESFELRVTTAEQTHRTRWTEGASVPPELEELLEWFRDVNHQCSASLSSGDIAPPQCLSDVRLDTTYQALGHRIEVKLPRDALVDPDVEHIGGLMGYERHHISNHRVGFNLPDTVVRITFLDNKERDDGHLPERLRTEAELPTLIPAEVVELSPDQHWVILPRDPRIMAEGKACMMAASFFVHPDGSVLRANGFVSPSAVEREGLEAMRQFFVRMLSEFRPGQRSVVRGPGEWLMPFPREEEVSVSCTLGPHVMVSTDVGADYLVHRFCRQVPLHYKDSLSMMIYLGNHPAPRLPQDLPTVDIPLFGSSLNWKALDGKDQYQEEIFVRETVIGIGRGGLAMHLQFEYRNQEEQDILLAMVASLRLA